MFLRNIPRFCARFWKPENIVFQDKFVPAGVEDGVDPIVTMMLSGKELALKIQKALGAASGEDE